MTTTVDLLAAHPFLADMPDAWLEQMSSYSTVVYWPAGDRLFSEGGRADGFWLIQEGRVALDLYVPGRGDPARSSAGHGCSRHNCGSSAQSSRSRRRRSSSTGGVCCGCATPSPTWATTCVVGSWGCCSAACRRRE